MTIDVYDGNNGIAMGLAEVGGGGVKADGALYQYMGSVATYQALLELDTTDFKPGYVYDVQEDGMDYAWTGTVWNALGTHTDLSGYYTKTETNTLLSGKANVTDLYNYYNKTQTDALLDEKQDNLTPNAPLTISKYTKSNLNGMVYNTDGTTIYTDPSTGSTFRGLYTYYAGGTTLIALTSLPNYFPSSNIPSLHDFYEQVGYVDIPYSMGYIVNTSNLQSNGFGSFTLGKVLNGEYIQILAFRYGGRSDYPWEWLVNISDETPTVVRTDNYYGAARITTSQSSGNFTTSKTNCSDALGTLTQIIDNTTSISVRFKIGSYLWTYTFTDAQLCTRIREIDTVRIFASYDRGYDINTAFQVSSIGLYNTDMQITGDETSYTPWGENLFDISGEQAYNYLDLHIGSGLSVDGDGNLVNTNPTAPTVMTGATSSAAGTSGLVPAPAAGDNTKFLKGDGTYDDIPTPDLTNYYTKSQTEALVEEKQDKLSANSPLSIATYTHSSLNGLAYDTSGDGYWSETLSTSGSTYFYGPYSGSKNGDNLRIQTYADSTTVASLDWDALWSGGYVDIPYTIGQTLVVCPEGSQNFPECAYPYLFGKYDSQGNFIPVYWDMPTWNNNNVSYGTALMYSDSDFVTVTKSGTTAYFDIPATIDSYSRSDYAGLSTSIMQGYFIKLSEDSSGYINSNCFNVQRRGSNNPFSALRNYTWTNSTAINRLKEITVVRIGANGNFGCESATDPYAFDKYVTGVYNYSGTPTTDLYGLAKENVVAALGTNLFDLSGDIKATYLDLHLGAGLAIQSGNLVNTNPTAPDLTNYVDLTSNQTIGGSKIFSNSISVNGSLTSRYNSSSSQRVVFNPTMNGAHFAVYTTDNWSGEIGVLGNSSNRKMYIQPPYNSTDLYINDYSDGSASNGIASTVTISGTNINTKKGGTTYTNLDSGNGVASSNIRNMTAVTQAEYDAIGALYAWGDAYHFTRSTTPSVGDSLYDASGQVRTGESVEAYDSSTDAITVSGSGLTRNSADDTTCADFYDATTLYVIRNVVA